MIIGISGKKQVGKDTIGKIIQSLDWYYNGYKNNIREKYSDIEYITKVINNEILEYSDYQIKKFADSLKDMVCILLNCTREQLEDKEFKEKELGEEWAIWKVLLRNGSKFGGLYLDEKIAKYTSQFSSVQPTEVVKEILTPRKLLQLLGTECGREIIHPNIWVNSVFADYRRSLRNVKNVPTTGMRTSMLQADYPDWIITDVRFPNEANAIKQKDSIIIRVNRSLESQVITSAKEKYNIDVSNALIKETFNELRKFEHPSESALDNYKFDYVIDNNGTIEELIKKVKEILIKEKII